MLRLIALYFHYRDLQEARQFAAVAPAAVPAKRVAPHAANEDETIVRGLKLAA